MNSLSNLPFSACSCSLGRKRKTGPRRSPSALRAALRAGRPHSIPAALSPDLARRALSELRALPWNCDDGLTTTGRAPSGRRDRGAFLMRRCMPAVAEGAIASRGGGSALAAAMTLLKGAEMRTLVGLLAAQSVLPAPASTWPDDLKIHVTQRIDFELQWLEVVARVPAAAVVRGRIFADVLYAPELGRCRTPLPVHVSWLHERVARALAFNASTTASKSEVRFEVNQSGCVSRHASGPIGVPEQLQLPGVGSS